MATKDKFLFFKDEHKSFDNCHNNTGAQYSVLKLNKNLKGSNIFPIQSKSKSYNNKKIDCTLSERYEEKEKSQTWKSVTDLSSKYSDSLSFNDENEKCWKKNGSSTVTNNSTLSLRICAYENSNEASLDPLIKSFQKSWLIQKQKQINLASTFVSQNPFEFQRQQNDKIPEPEVSQFKSSQRLLNSENTKKLSLQAVLLTMMLEKIDNLSNRINEMQIASGDIKEACDKLNDRIGAFEEKFEQVLQHQSSEPDQRTATPVETDEEKENVSQHLNNSQTLGNKFVKKEDEWDCQTCYVRNQLNDDNCVSCGTSKDGKEETTPAPAFKPITFSSANNSYSFSLNKSAQKSLLGTPPTTKPAVAVAPSSVKTKAETDNSKPAEAKPLFGDKTFSLASPQPAASSPVKTQAQTVGSKPPGTKSLFGNKPFTFAPPPQPAVTQAKESPFDAKPATDESQPKSLFGGTGSSNANKTPLSFSSFASGTSFLDKAFLLDKKTADTPNASFGARTSSTFANQRATEENENPEEYVPDAHYEPVIPLPDKVDIVTGEESEEVLFKNRCKLYIFNSETKEIKERGVGDIKVLFNPENKSYRVVMRREQVHKICANFRITKGMNIADKTGTKGCGIFSCIDFSENPQNGTSTVFFARFREEKVYEEFKKLFNEIAEGNHVPSGVPSTNAGESIV